MHRRKFNFKRREKGSQTEYESAYETMLRLREDVDQYYFERLKIRLADNTYYTPDFVVMLVSGEIEFVEVKGSWKMPGQDDARVKIKVAAEQNPWATFRSVELKKDTEEKRRRLVSHGESVLSDTQINLAVHFVVTICFFWWMKRELE